jgi:hypothetical protein
MALGGGGGQNLARGGRGGSLSYTARQGTCLRNIGQEELTGEGWSTVAHIDRRGKIVMGWTAHGGGRQMVGKRRGDKVKPMTAMEGGWSGLSMASSTRTMQWPLWLVARSRCPAVSLCGLHHDVREKLWCTRCGSWKQRYRLAQ